MFADKKILVIGAGVSGFSAAAALAKCGAQYVCLNDIKPVKLAAEVKERLQKQGIDMIFGQQDKSLLDQIDYVIVSPGIPRSIPILTEASQRNIPIISEIEVASRLCKCPILAVTGTNGKTTTVSLLAELMKQTGRPVIIGGNIGMGLAEQVTEGPDNAIVVAELSSYQLESTETLCPQISAVLNVTPDHLERHKTMEAYWSAKEKIFLNQGQRQTTVLNFDNEITRKMAEDAASHVLFFSMHTVLEDGAYYKDGKLYLAKNGECREICSRDTIHLLGDHNIENCLAAVLMADAFGVSLESIKKVLSVFSGVEHRIEPVRTIHGVPYYNDSKATNVDSSIKALESFDGHIILIAGGYDKMNDLQEFMALAAKKTDALLLIGNAAERFYAAAQQAGIKDIRRLSSMEEAVRTAYEIAAPPQTVLLSPACSSYDMFRCFEERGTVFKTLVNALEE